MKKQGSTFLLIVCLAGFAAGLVELFKLRFEAGDVYPPYSSLRADPLGTMALFEGLARLPGVSVVRDFSSNNRLPEGPGSTYLHLASTQQEWLWIPEELAQQVQNYVVAGGRLVISFLPETSRPFVPSTPPVTPGKPPPKMPKPGSKNAPSSPLFKDRWGVEFAFVALPKSDDQTYDSDTVQNRTNLPLPNSLDWHSGMVFTNLNSAWTKVYSRGTNPVVVERKFGSGSVVLLSDSFCLSNEAMVEDRHPELLAWMVGDARHIEFDESHLGITESPGVAGLMRQYRLHGLVAGVLLLTGLFIWKHSVSFLPRRPEAVVQSEVQGRDSSAGFVNLLRRNIAPREILRVCFDEWTKSFSRRGAHSIARVDQAQAVFQAEVNRLKTEQDPVRAYREIRNVLKATTQPSTLGGTSSSSPHSPTSEGRVP